MQYVMSKEAMARHLGGPNEEIVFPPNWHLRLVATDASTLCEDPKTGRTLLYLTEAMSRAVDAVLGVEVENNDEAYEPDVYVYSEFDADGSDWSETFVRAARIADPHGFPEWRSGVIEEAS